jgi:hypothetical protein
MAATWIITSQYWRGPEERRSSAGEDDWGDSKQAKSKRSLGLFGVDALGGFPSCLLLA